MALFRALWFDLDYYKLILSKHDPGVQSSRSKFMNIVLRNSLMFCTVSVLYILNTKNCRAGHPTNTNCGEGKPSYCPSYICTNYDDKCSVLCYMLVKNWLR